MNRKEAEAILVKVWREKTDKWFINSTANKYKEVFIDAMVEFAAAMLEISEISGKGGWSDQQMKDCFDAGRDYQRGEESEWRGGPEHNYPNFPAYLASLTPTKEASIDGERVVYVPATSTDFRNVKYITPMGLKEMGWLKCESGHWLKPITR